MADQEWRLYPPLLEHWRGRGMRAAASVRDPRGRRVELDVVAFDDALDDVRVVEAKARATGVLVRQAASRLEYAPRAYAAVPAREVDALARLVERAEGAAASLGVLGVERGAVHVAREAAPRPDLRVEARAAVLERALRALLTKGSEL